MNRYTVINRGTWYLKKEDMGLNKKILITRHNAGFFSCCSYRLIDIMIYFNENKGLPDEVDSHEQFSHYKGYPQESLISLYFKDRPDIDIPYLGRVDMTTSLDEPQFSPYNQIVFKDTTSFVTKYFTPSDHVGNQVGSYVEKYSLDFNNLCAVFYRGNDKKRETEIAPYSEFIRKAKQVLTKNPSIKFLVQPDETEFLDTFKNTFPGKIICFEETPHMPKKDSCMFYELPLYERAEYGAKFFAAVLCLSKCKHLITHSGNGGNWSVLFRGNCDNVYQWLINKWTDE